MASGNVSPRSDKMPHGLLSLYPRASASCPSGAYAQDHLDPDAFALVHDIGENVDPFRAHEVYLSPRHSYVDLKEDDITYSLLSHGLKVFCYAFFGEIPIHEVPVHSRPGVRGRCLEINSHLFWT